MHRLLPLLLFASLTGCGFPPLTEPIEAPAETKKDNSPPQPYDPIITRVMVGSSDFEATDFYEDPRNGSCSFYIESDGQSHRVSVHDHYTAIELGRKSTLRKAGE